MMINRADPLITDCPYKPGTPEWSQWQRTWLDAEKSRITGEGTGGATMEDKRAAGFAETDTIRGPRYRLLDEYPEPWRTVVEKRMWAYVPKRANPLECPWCGRTYKTQRWIDRHTKFGICQRFLCWSPRWDGYQEGTHRPVVRNNGRIVGCVAASEDDAAPRVAWDHT